MNASLCEEMVRWDDVTRGLHSSLAFEILALIQTITVAIISVIFWAVFLTSPYPLKVGFAGNPIGRFVMATASVRNRTVISISDYCAASGSTPQRILMTLCTIFSMLSISAALFCEDRLKMWSMILSAEHTPYFRQQSRILWMFIGGQLGMFFTGNMEVRDGPKYFQTFFMLMHTAGAIGFILLAPLSAWWFNGSQMDAFFWLMVSAMSLFASFSLLSFFTDAYKFCFKPKAMNRIFTEPMLKPGSHEIQVQVTGLKQLNPTADFIAREIVITDKPSNGAKKRLSPSIAMDPVFHQMWLNHALGAGFTIASDPLVVKMRIAETGPPPARGFWSAVFVTLEFLAMVLAATSSILLTLSFARLNYLNIMPDTGSKTCYVGYQNFSYAAPER